MNYKGFRPPFCLCIKLWFLGSGKDSDKDVSLKALVSKTGEVLLMLDIPRFSRQEGRLWEDRLLGLD